MQESHRFPAGILKIMGIWEDVGFDDRYLAVPIFMDYLVDRNWDAAVVLKD
jgi:hypothetical protein